MRYIVIPVTLDKKHPLWPNEQVYYIKDLHTGNLSFSCYKTYKEAEGIAKEKNKG